MAEISHKITIQRPSFDVFKAVADFKTAAEWQPNTVQISLSAAEPLRVGTMISQTRRFMGRTVFMNADVIEYVPNKKIELKGIFIIFPFTRTITVDSSGGGQSTLSDHITLRTGCIYFWYTPILTAGLRGQTKAEWDTLRRRLESRQ